MDKVWCIFHFPSDIWIFDIFLPVFYKKMPKTMNASSSSLLFIGQKSQIIYISNWNLSIFTFDHGTKKMKLSFSEKKEKLHYWKKLKFTLRNFFHLSFHIFTCLYHEIIIKSFTSWSIATSNGEKRDWHSRKWKIFTQISHYS